MCLFCLPHCPKCWTLGCEHAQACRGGGHLFFQASIPEGPPELVPPEVGAAFGSGGASFLSLQASYPLVWGQGALGQGGHPGVAHGPCGQARLQHLSQPHSVTLNFWENL